MANALLQYASDEKTAAAAAVSGAAAKLDTSDTTSLVSKLKQARADLLQAQNDLTAKQVEIEADRQKLATTTIPADAESLLAQIATEIQAARGLTGQVQNAKDTVASLEAEVAAAQAALNAARARLAAAQAALVSATSDDARWTRLTAALQAAPLDTLKQDATDATGAEPYTTAAAKVGAVPAALRDLVASRVKTVLARLELERKAPASAAVLLGGATGTTGGAAGKVSKAQVALDAADASLIDYTTEAKLRYDRALSLLTTVAASAVLSDAELARLSDGTADVVTKGEAAAALDVTVNEKQQAYDQAEAAFEDHLLEVQAADPTADGAGAEKTARDNAKTELDAARAALQPKRADLDAWMVLVPDAAWLRLAAFYEAKSILTDLAAKDPAPLPTALKNAQDALPALLKAAAGAVSQSDVLQAAVERRRADATAAAGAITERWLSAVRGDPQ